MHDTLCLYIRDCLLHRMMNLLNPTVAPYLPIFQRLLNRPFLHGVLHLPPRVFIGNQMLWIQDIQHLRFVFRVVSSDRAHYQHTAWRWTQCCRIDRRWLVGCVWWFCVFRSRVLAYQPKKHGRMSRRWRRRVEDQGLLAPVVGVRVRGWGRWWECRWPPWGVLLPATRSGLGSFPSSWIILIGDAPMHHESLKVHSEYVEKLVDVNRSDVQYIFSQSVLCRGVW